MMYGIFRFHINDGGILGRYVLWKNFTLPSRANIGAVPKDRTCHLACEAGAIATSYQDHYNFKILPFASKAGASSWHQENAICITYVKMLSVMQLIKTKRLRLARLH